MSNSNIIRTRILIRRDTTANWNSVKDFIPLKGEFIVYTDYRTNENGVNIPAIKIGDGSAYLIDLPFITDATDAGEVANILEKHVNDNNIHVSDTDRDTWDNKVTCSIDGEILRLN